jgi:pimeloyl-ACP methyl ester carboxylesterase
LRFQRYVLLTALVLLWVFAYPSSSIASPVSQTFDANGVKLHYLIEGTGEPVVLIHGLDSSARINWQMPGTIDAIARDHQVIALDLPGFGQSDKPVEAQANGLQWVEDVILLLDHLNIRKAHIVGYSMGGMVALKLIAEHPDRVLSGTLGGVGWLPDGGFLQKVWAHMRSVSSRGVSELALTEQELQAIRIPVLILVGDRDPMRKLYVVPLQKVRNDWQVIEIQGAGHLNCIFKKQFIEEIEKWLVMNRQK